jgi:hypothetical protein
LSTIFPAPTSLETGEWRQLRVLMPSPVPRQISLTSEIIPALGVTLFLVARLAGTGSGTEKIVTDIVDQILRDCCTTMQQDGRKAHDDEEMSHESSWGLTDFWF